MTAMIRYALFALVVVVFQPFHNNVQMVHATVEPVSTAVSTDNGGGSGDGTETTDGTCSAPDISYVLLAVSGTLEEGFELRRNMDYVGTNGGQQDRVNATFLGKALVRGYKGYLDIKNPNWREYKDTTKSPLSMLKTVNPAILPTGCREHAHRYSIYMVDARQLLHVLGNEPRFLSIAPDMGLVDLTASDEWTWPDIKSLAKAYATNSEYSGLFSGQINLNSVAFLTVTSTWHKRDTMVGLPTIYNNHDMMVTDFPESTALWSRQILNLHATHEVYPEGCGSDPMPHLGDNGSVVNLTSALDYQECIHAAIVLQEAEYDNNNHNLPPYTCQQPARYGTDAHTARINKALTACQWEHLMMQAGIVLETDSSSSSFSGSSSPKFTLQGCSR